MPDEIIETEENRPSGVQNAIDRFAKLTTFEDKKPAPEAAPEAPKVDDVAPPEKPAEKAPEAKAADVTPPEPPEVVKMDLPANISQKAASDFKKIKDNANREIAAREAQITQLKQEVEAAKQAAKPVEVTKAPEYEALQKQYQELDSKMKVVAIERHPAFIEYFGNKTKIALDTAKSVVGPELAPKLERILKTGDPELRSAQLEDLAGELSPFKQGELANAVATLRAIDAERAAEIEKAGKAHDTLQTKAREEQEQTLAQRKAQAEQTKNASLTLARATMDAFKTKEGDDAHNAAVKANEAIVTSFFDGTINPKLMTAIPALAAEAMHLRQSEIPRLEAELKKRDAIIATYQGAAPKVSQGSVADTTPAQPTGSKFMSKMAELWPGANK